MLEIINSLAPFFEDCYRRISVREYARLMKISPPTASKQLELYKRKGLLKKEVERMYFYYFADKDGWLFAELSRIYWRRKLEAAGLLNFFEKEFFSPIVILFGSLAKAEAKANSDIDIAVFTSTNKIINLKEFEKKLKRNVQLFLFSSRDAVKNPELLNNLLNGYVMKGSW